MSTRKTFIDTMYGRDTVVDVEQSDSDYLRGLSDRLRRIPASFGTDGYDCDRLWHIAAQLDVEQRDRER